MQPQHCAGEAALHWLDRNVLALNQSEPLKRRFEVIFGRIEEKILGDLHDVAIEDRFLRLVLFAGRLGSHLDHEFRGLALAPDQVMISHRLLGYATDHEHVGRDMLSPVPALVEHQKIAGDIDIGVPGEMVFQSRDQVLHLVAMKVGFTHGSAIPRRILDVPIFVDHCPRNCRHDHLLRVSCRRFGASLQIRPGIRRRGSVPVGPRSRRARESSSLAGGLS